MGERNLLRAKALFHVKLAGILETRGLGAADVARLMPEVDPSLVLRWMNADDGKGRIPTGVYMCWLLMALDLRPEELVGPLPGSEHANLQPESGQNPRSAFPEGSDACWLLEALERLVGDFRRHLDEEKGEEVANGSSG
ncbi:hypothetical protein LCGC14_1585630 [marine sediment metagenome]|uniref:HTH cro/C1-type domain-containing protein n=1 Tax=marine sediment metagenome TaxID=412755 RepID=A0A0F9LFU5_9ZZZZ